MNYSTLMWMATLASSIGLSIGKSPELREELARAEQSAFVCTTEMDSRLDMIEERFRLYLNAYEDVLQPSILSTTD